ncbi:MAG: enoyl-CoA hydratase/isomerase family protein [Nitriliruptorales bacterium]|nr:enoyl-CoA hydratase/isomerase family protein [Nitriliruptorales bacterium]
MAATEEPIVLRREGAVAVISFNRPDKHNAANDALDAGLWAILRELHADDDIRCAILRGEGKSFSSGRDMEELGQRPGGISDLDFIAQGHAGTELFLSSPVPIIAALKGWVIGGSFERALLCDMRIAAEDTRMMLPEVAHGVIPDSAGIARLFQMCGHGVAADLALTGRVMDAEEALRHGVVSRIVPTDELDDAVMEVAQKIAGSSRLAVRMARHTLGELATPPVIATLHRELLAQTVVMAGDEFRSARGRD